MAEKDNKALIWLGAAGIGLYFLAHKQGQAAAHSSTLTGSNPAIPPPLNTPVLTNAQQLQGWTNWAHNLLASYGYKTVPSYVTSTSATEEIVDTTPANRNLVQRNQAYTDNFHQFMWDVNAALVYKTVDPNDPTFWSRVTQEYTNLQNQFTPTFLT